jgi:hypothetical protein
MDRLILQRERIDAAQTIVAQTIQSGLQPEIGNQSLLLQQVSAMTERERKDPFASSQEKNCRVRAIRQLLKGLGYAGLHKLKPGRRRLARRRDIESASKT